MSGLNYYGIVFRDFLPGGITHFIVFGFDVCERLLNFDPSYLSPVGVVRLAIHFLSWLNFHLPVILDTISVIRLAIIAVFVLFAVPIHLVLFLVANSLLVYCLLQRTNLLYISLNNWRVSLTQNCFIHDLLWRFNISSK